MHISISKKAILWAIAFLIGFIMLSQGISAKVRYSNTIPFSELDYVHCIEGNYIVGTIDNYLQKPIQNLGNGSYSGVSATYLTATATYDIYNVPIKNNQYIRIMVANPDTKRLLADNKDADSDRLYFEGKIVDAPIELNADWYKDITGFDANNVIADFMVEQTPAKSISNMFWGGISILLCCVFVLLSGNLKGAIIIAKTE